MIPSNREPTHPGEMLLQEFLKPSGLTQVAAAARMHIPLNRLNEIIRGRRGVTADTAIRLAKLFGTSAEFWMNLQSAWDIYHAAKSMHVDLGDVLASNKREETSSQRSEAFHVAAWSANTLIKSLIESASVPTITTEEPSAACEEVAA